MEVKVVIITELPNSCKQCSLHDGVYIADEGENKPTMYAVDCCVTGLQMDWEAGYECRPDWCPLMTHDQAFDWMFSKQPATPYIRCRLEDIMDFGKGRE
jgi:hypothetical protein